MFYEIQCVARHFNAGRKREGKVYRGWLVWGGRSRKLRFKPEKNVESWRKKGRITLIGKKGSVEQ